jgi:diguanylate cyclase (GGDEF)-like protein
VSGVLGLPEVSLVGAFLGAVAGVLLLQEPVRVSQVDERDLWRWCRRGCWALAAGALAALGLAGAYTAAAGWVLTVGCVGLAAMLYQALVRWNRYRTMLSDPGDWLNGIGAVSCAVALGLLVVPHLPGGTSVAGHLAAAGVVRLCVAVVVLGAAGTVVAIADLRRDPRALLIVIAVVLVVVVECVSMASALAGSMTAADAPWPAVLGWGLLPLVLAVAGGTRAGRQPAGYASSQATTAGSIVVMGSAIVILLVHALLDESSVLVPVLAAAGALAAGVRVVRLVRDLASLASSRIEARTDALTGVANRRALVEAVDTFSFRPQGAALLVIDLDRFKDVNDRYGHQVGDEVIRALADRLRAELPSDALLARLGGDEFAVVLEDPDPQRASAIAVNACDVLARPVQVEGRVIRVAASIGVASTTLGEHRDGELLRCADAAMYVAKRGGGGVQIYDQAADERGRDRAQRADELRAMLEAGSTEHGRLVLRYQPQIEAGNGRISAVEALVRWQHPRHGLLAPAQFLDLAEEHGLMTPLTWQVLDQATRQLATWRTLQSDLRIAVNLSTSCLEYPGLLEALQAALRGAGLAPDSLIVEITETSLMHDPDLAIDVTRQIHDAGISISIDDYGTGYSSLSYLNDLPADELKLDLSFTGKLTSDTRTAAIVSATIALAHQIGLQVVAEGVEDEETLRALTALGCDRTQGYLHGRPVPAGELEYQLTGLSTTAR